MVESIGRLSERTVYCRRHVLPVCEIQTTSSSYGNELSTAYDDYTVYGRDIEDNTGIMSTVW